MLRTFIQITSIGLTLTAAIILAKGNLTMSPRVIAELQISRAGYHETVIHSLSSQSADTRVGIVLLCLAFALQLWNSLWPMRYVDYKVNSLGVIWQFSFRY
jgi:hypothetical protein